MQIARNQRAAAFELAAAQPVRALMAEAPLEAQRLKALVLIAPAWDVAELMWSNLPEGARREIMDKGIHLRPSRYGDGPYPITRAFIEEARRHRLGEAPFDPGRPVHILHGLLDPDVPWEHTLDLVARHGKVDILVNKAGINHQAGLVMAKDLDSARAEMETNYFGPLSMCRAFAPILANNCGALLSTCCRFWHG